MPRLNDNDPRAPYVQIADDLRRSIAAGQLRPGDRLRSGRDLARDYGVAPMTVQHALAALRDEGLLISWQGRGVFVRDPKAERALPEQPQDALAQVLTRLEAVHDEVRHLAGRVASLEQRDRGSRTSPRRPSGKAAQK
jgi:DNA-binding GntR family transcriptional regulator